MVDGGRSCKRLQVLRQALRPRAFLLSPPDKGVSDSKETKQDIWLSSNVTSCTFEESKKEWTMHLTQKGVERVIVAPNLLLSMGAGGSVPLIPKYKGQVRSRSSFLDTILS